MSSKIYLYQSDDWEVWEDDRLGGSIIVDGKKTGTFMEWRRDMSVTVGADSDFGDTYGEGEIPTEVMTVVFRYILKNWSQP